MEESKKLELSEEDIHNTKETISELIDVVVKFAGNAQAWTEAQFEELKSVLDFSQFVISGVIYSNGMDLCAGHDHDEES